MTRVLAAAAAQHNHLFHVTGPECAWGLGIVLVVVVIGALARVLG